MTSTQEPFFLVKDGEASLAFYTQTLGHGRLFLGLEDDQIAAPEERNLILEVVG